MSCQPEEYLEGPFTSKIRPTVDNCLFCIGKKGPISDKGLSSSLTRKGLASIGLIKTCKERQDNVAKVVLLHRIKNASKFPFKLHFSCRSIYTDSKRMLCVKHCREKSEHAQGARWR